MKDDIQVPEHMPEPGFYYHYKHDPNGPENLAAYEVPGTGWHTENGEFCALYRPLYEGWALKSGVSYLRPVSMFMDTVEKAEYSGPRFIRITDPALIERLKVLKKELYG